MSYLLDVNMLLACGWGSHRQHAKVAAWIARQPLFYTCAIVELGFVRVSMSPAYQASFVDAQTALASITQMKSARFLMDDLHVSAIPVVTSYSDTTDAYLVGLARKHAVTLATLDDILCKRAWAASSAVNPI